MKQSVLYYCAIVLVILGSVLFGLDWQSATLSPMPPIQVVALPPPPPPAPPTKIVTPNAAPSPATPANPVTPRKVAPAPAATNNTNAPIAANPPVAQTPPKCDISACAAAYRSFRESDCTYNPSFGERRLCTKGVVPTETSATPDAPPSIIQAEPNAPTNAQTNVKCNVSACAAAFGSFTASDCTYQPTNGPRRLCAK